VKHVRYAVVGLGHIAQVAVLPAFAHAHNSRVTAIVSGDRTKRESIASKYRLEAAFSYDEYEECLQSVDAVYIALPNSQHAEYAIRAARAGVHVLCEKPMAVTPSDCRRMIVASRKARVKLMIAYRLHFEATTLEVIDLIHKGRIGEPKFFNSSFAMTVRRGDIRTRKSMGGGTLYDIGVYCINAARMAFRAEPVSVTACSVNSGAARVREIDETTGAVLDFGKGRLATFVTSFNAADTDAYRIVGTKGDVRVSPGYEYAESLSYELTIDGKTKRVRRRRTDQFAAELLYFSNCILKDRIPEPSGEEGLQDVRIVEALYTSSRTGKTVKLPPFTKTSRPDREQVIMRPPVKKPQLIKEQSASED
jgi:glucose-fructose oxidoreductase